LTKTIYIVVAPSGYWEHVCSNEQSAKETCWAEFESHGCKGYTVEKWNATKEDQQNNQATSLEELKAAWTAAEAALAAEAAAWDADEASYHAAEDAEVAAWDAYRKELKKQENLND
jgi:hypothetical protein